MKAGRAGFRCQAVGPGAGSKVAVCAVWSVVVSRPVAKVQWWLDPDQLRGDPWARDTGNLGEPKSWGGS